MGDEAPRQDERFTPFNFSRVMPFDSTAEALAALPVASAREPAGGFDNFVNAEASLPPPSEATRAQMMDLLAETQREG